MNSLQGDIEPCDSCLRGKFNRKPFVSNNHEIESVSHPLERIHMDLCGPMPEVSLGSSKYIMVLVDQYSRRIFVEFLKHKNEVFQKFIEFASRRENEINAKIKYVRTDNGGEFINNLFNEYFKEKGIKHEKTTPYTPQSNGLAERTNRTLLDKARTLLIESQLPLKFWAEAATAEYVNNCCPNKSSNKTPMELWNKKKPSVAHFRIFGCTVYFHVDKSQRNKLQPKSRCGIFLGYSRSRKAYRIYDMEKCIVTESRDVQFLEDKFGLITNNQKIEEESLSYRPLITSVLIQHHDAQEPRVEHNLNEMILENSIDNPDNFYECEEQIAGDPVINQTVSLLEVDPQLRRSKRIQAKTGQFALQMSSINKLDCPNSYQEAMQSQENQKWTNAMNEEMSSLKQHGVWELVDRPINAKVIKSRWVFKIKSTNYDESIRFKARLVAVGCNQKPGIDYESSFSPVMRLETFRILMALSAKYELKLKIFDVVTAYLHAELNESVFMEQPEGYKNDGKVCKLLKSLYGLPQSGRCWNMTIDKILQNVGMERLKSDPCVYIHKNDQNFLVIGVYVDDLFVLGTSLNIIDSVMAKISSEINLKESNTSTFLGIKINTSFDKITISQEEYIDKILMKYNLQNCNPTKTPGSKTQDLYTYEESQQTDVNKYQEMLGSLMYVSQGTRPDITYCVSKLAQFSKDPRQIHLNALKRVYRYLKGTKSKCITYNKNMDLVTISTDASWCSTDDAKSFSGYVGKLGNNIIAWKSCKQKLVALSTMESELMSLCQGVREMRWVVEILEELQMNNFVKKPIKSNIDSTAVIDWVINMKTHGRTKHINRIFHFVRDEYKNGDIKLQHTPTDDMEADLLTKDLSQMKMEHHMISINLIDG